VTARHRPRRAWPRAQRLRRALSGTDHEASTVGDQLTAVVADIGADLRIELVPSPALELPASPASDALSEAVREALRNVIKHSGAHTAVVMLDRDRGELLATVRDHGRGFDSTAAEGFGLSQSIRARLAEYGGTADVRSTPGGGTRVQMRLPT
jgi:signal transduction histidine kinase